ARRCERGDEVETAVEYWKRAGDRTMAGGAYVESIRLFECGLALLRHLPEWRRRTMHELLATRTDAPGRVQQALNLQVLLGQALAATEGYGARDVTDAFGRARELAREDGGPPG